MHIYKEENMSCLDIIIIIIITIITYLLYATTALEDVWPPYSEGFCIWFNFSYTYFLLEAEWWVISQSLHEPTT